MAELIPGMSSINFMPILNQAAYWLGIILLAIIIIVVFIWIGYTMQFKIKATIIPMYGSGKDGVFSVGKPKKNRLKWNKEHTAWKSLMPLFNRKEREPFDTEYIYPGQQVYIFELNDEWVPGRVNITQTEKELRAEINPVPYYIRNWQSLTHKKNAVEFAKQGFWEENKYLFITLGVVFACCALVAATIYFTYKFAGAGSAEINILADAIGRFSNVPSSTVPG